MSWSSYVLARMLRATLGDRTWVTHYADDLVIWADTCLGCYQRLQEINELLIAHGWLPHKLKEVAPSQRPEILGVHFDLKQKTCRIGRSYIPPEASARTSQRSHAHNVHQATDGTVHRWSFLGCNGPPYSPPPCTSAHGNYVLCQKVASLHRLD